MTPANFPRAATVRRMANDVTYTMYTALNCCVCRVFSSVCVCDDKGEKDSKEEILKAFRLFDDDETVSEASL